MKIKPQNSKSHALENLFAVMLPQASESEWGMAVERSASA